MTISRTQLSDVVYNAATQSFDARITIHDGAYARSYACSSSAPIATDFDVAAARLARQALHKHGYPRGLRSWISKTSKPRLVKKPRRGLPLGSYGFFRGRAA